MLYYENVCVNECVDIWSMCQTYSDTEIPPASVCFIVRDST